MAIRMTILLLGLAWTMSALAQTNLPFTGTRNFCGTGIDKGVAAVVTINKDGKTLVKIRNLGWEPTGKLISFSGRLNSKWMLSGPRDRHLTIKSASHIAVSYAQDGFDAKLCKR